MPYQPRGPREWKPGMKEGIVQGPYDNTFTLRFSRDIRSKKDLRSVRFGDFKANAELAVERKDPLEIYFIDEHRDKKRKSIGELAWFPGFRRGGIITWEEWESGVLGANWTDATNPLDALERWVWGKMVDDPF